MYVHTYVHTMHLSINIMLYIRIYIRNLSNFIYQCYTDTNFSEVEEESLQNCSKAMPATKSIIPIAGLGMELQCLLKQDGPVPFDIHFQLDDGSLLGAHSVVLCARCSWFMNALER